MNITEYERFLNSQPELKKDNERADQYFENLQIIKKYYQENEKEILDYHAGNPKSWYTSYPVDWFSFFSPIERIAWESIRCLGGLVMYPQYPILNYYADFANPGYKIAIELDGKAFHNEKRDKARDEQLKAAGWTVYRITGSEMVNGNFMNYSEIYEMFHSYFEKHEAASKLRYWLMKTGDGILTAIKEIHILKNDVPDSDDELLNKKINYCLKTLEIHKS